MRDERKRAEHRGDGLDLQIEGRAGEHIAVDEVRGRQRQQGRPHVAVDARHRLAEQGPGLRALRAVALVAIFLSGVLVEGQPQEVDADDARAGEEHVAPVHQAQVAGDDGAEEAADVDQLIEDAPADRGVGRPERRRERALHAGFEDRRAGRQHHAAEEEAPVVHAVGHQRIADDLEDDRERDGALVAVAVGEPAGEHRQHALHAGPPGEDRALLDVAELGAALRLRQDHVDRHDRPHAVVGEALEHLHDVDDPEPVVQPDQLVLQAASRHLVRHVCPPFGGLYITGPSALDLSGDGRWRARRAGRARWSARRAAGPPGRAGWCRRGRRRGARGRRGPTAARRARSGSPR